LPFKEGKLLRQSIAAPEKRRVLDELGVLSWNGRWANFGVVGCRHSSVNNLNKQTDTSITNAA